MTLFLLSLTGIPPTAGFFAKAYVILAAVQAGGPLTILAVIAVLNAAAAAFYYLRVVVYMFMREPASEAPPQRHGRLMWSGLAVATALTILLGFFPGRSSRSSARRPRRSRRSGPRSRDRRSRDQARTRGDPARAPPAAAPTSRADASDEVRALEHLRGARPSAVDRAGQAPTRPIGRRGRDDRVEGVRVAQVVAERDDRPGLVTGDQAFDRLPLAAGITGPHVHHGPPAVGRQAVVRRAGRALDRPRSRRRRPPGPPGCRRPGGRGTRPTGPCARRTATAAGRALGDARRQGLGRDAVRLEAGFDHRREALRAPATSSQVPVCRP